MQVPAQNSRHSYWRFIVFLNNYDRDEIIKKLNALNIKADAPYFPLLHNQPLFKDIKKEKMINAEKLSKTHISLPIHMLISENDAKFIIKTFIGFFND